MYFVGRTNGWGAKLLGLRQTSALQIKTRSDSRSTFIQRNKHLNKDLTLVSTSNFLWEQVWSGKQLKGAV